MGCFTSILLLALFVFVLVSMIRWFEQATEAVERGWWNKVLVLLAMPFAVWFFPSRVSAGRPTPAPRHEPVRGFGTGTSTAARGPADGAGAAPSDDHPALPLTPAPAPAPAPISPDDQPPPGTPKEFLGLPTIPPPEPRPRPGADPEKVAKLRQKMREQGMLPPEGPA